VDTVAAAAPILVGWMGGPDAEEFVQHDEQFIIERALESLARCECLS